MAKDDFSPMIDSASELTRLFRILSDATRLRVLRLLWREELTVNELSEITQLAQPRISNHLKILREENLIVERRSGSLRPYRVDHKGLDPAASALWPSLEEAWRDDPQFAADDKRLTKVLAARISDVGAGYFDQLARRWDDIRNDLFGDALGREVLRAFVPPNLTIADVGTGTGYMLHLFAGRFEKFIAIDNSEAMLAVAREKAKAAVLRNVEFRLADVETAPPLKPREANIITIVQVLHHLHDPAVVIANLANGLQRNGSLIISDFVEHDQQWLRTEFHHRWPGFTKKQITAWAKAAQLSLASWSVLPGRAYTPTPGNKVLIPDCFTAVLTHQG
ncbi:MAG TPA: metalloregulator ArsR/SmtB family transcription factor [Candidatus Sumerlaeota bacterium]|nr:metalloregulator ArsR/SmtB family transcription factor [Candidatus Sumerlaeota bacterium]